MSLEIFRLVGGTRLVESFVPADMEVRLASPTIDFWGGVLPFHLPAESPGDADADVPDMSQNQADIDQSDLTSVEEQEGWMSHVDDAVTPWAEKIEAALEFFQLENGISKYTEAPLHHMCVQMREEKWNEKEEMGNEK